MCSQLSHCKASKPRGWCQPYFLARRCFQGETKQTPGPWASHGGPEWLPIYHGTRQTVTPCKLLFLIVTDMPGAVERTTPQVRTLAYATLWPCASSHHGEPKHAFFHTRTRGLTPPLEVQAGNLQS